MSTNTEETVLVVPQSFNALEVNGKISEHLTTILKKQHSDLTHKNTWNKTNDDVSHSIKFNKGWFEGFVVTVDYKNATRKISLSTSTSSKLEENIAVILGVPITLISFIAMTQFLGNVFETENLSFLGFLVSLAVGTFIGGAIGYGASFFLGKLIVPVDVRVQNQERANSILQTCVSAAQEFISTYTAPKSPVQVPIEAPVQTPSLPEKTEKVDTSKLCPRCYTESNTFFVCKECGYVNKTVGIVLFVIASIGLAIGVHGLLAWIAAEGTLWVEIVKTLLCGFPGVLFAYWGIAELIHLRKSRLWVERHNHDMRELLGFYAKNPNASFDEAGKFLNHTGQWVELMLNESKSKK